MDGEVCDCIGFEDYDPPEFYSKAIRKAAKDYVCCECSGDIIKGTEHEYVTGKSEGNWWNYRTCIGCMNLRNDTCKCGFIHGTLADCVYEAFGVDIIHGDDDEEEDDEGNGDV